MCEKKLFTRKHQNVNYIITWFDVYMHVCTCVWGYIYIYTQVDKGVSPVQTAHLPHRPNSEHSTSEAPVSEATHIGSHQRQKPPTTWEIRYHVVVPADLQ